MNAEVVSNLNKPSVSTAQPKPVSGNLLVAVLRTLASLKLTVALLMLAVLVTFVGTLEQTRADIHTVKSKYFLENRILVEVPLNVFMVPAWFPQFQNLSGSIYLPSGMTILILMILNMAAAHLIRFRLQAEGLRLAAGLLVALLAGFFTWAIIFNSPDRGTIPGEPPIPWFRMWLMLQIVVLGVACGAAFGYFSLPKEKKYERLFMGLAALIAGGALILTMILPNKGFVGDSAMRILWQLSQSTAAASIGLVACMLIFRRKGGIVLLHLGILGLMANELYVNYTNVEQRMSLMEGETSNLAADIRSIELAIIDVSDPEVDQISVVPQSILKSVSKIQNDQLPFDIKVVEFLENSDIIEVKNRASNKATQGLGTKWEAIPVPSVSGVDNDTRNIASTYVEFLEKQTGKSLGTFLVSQFFENVEAKRLSRDSVEFDGKKYYLDLRFKREYKPYKITLRDVKAEYYIGTDVPKYFSSDIVFNDSSNDVSFEKHIWMNNPMRYAGETFYQTSYDRDKTGREFSALQIVKNRGWMIPYVCCMFTVVGLLVQFGNSLLSYLEKRAKSTASALPAKQKASNFLPPVSSKPAVSLVGEVPMAIAVEPSGKSVWNWLPAALLTAVFGIYIAREASTAYRGTVTKEEFRLDLLGQIPVTQNGRVQPLDSVARHSALQMNKREFVNNQLDSPQPAIRWLADTMFGAEGYQQYRLFRIEEAEVLTALDLPFPMPTKERHKHSMLRYTLEELLKAEPKFLKLLDGDSKTFTPFQKKVARVFEMLTRSTAMEMALGYPKSEEMRFFERLQLSERASKNEALPLLVPTGNPERPVMSFPALEDQIWLKELGEKYKANTTSDLAEIIVREELLPGLRSELIEDRLIEDVSKEYAGLEREELERVLTPKLLETKRKEVATSIDTRLEQETPMYQRLIEGQFARIIGKSGPLETSFLPIAKNLGQLREAYQSGDATTFNRVLEEYLSAIKTSPPAGMRLSGVATEYWYNRFAPFYWATVIYAAAVLLGMFSWIGFSEPLNRAAGWLLWLGFLVHLIGMISRIVISGRPPVTNLYSSFLFTAMIAVLGLGLLERFTKLRVNYFLGGLNGFLGLLVAWNMTLSDGDTFSVLVAVLDTQFWLATHVVTITIGYGATMMAGFLGLMYVFKGLFTSSLIKQSRRSLSDVIYGTVCFGLVTSFFGTVLGGLWGDDSWGRFWGWDPKENGALMIVLWNAVILHARWGGVVRERGTAILAILGTIITLWSWKGVNALGVGLHAYSGTEDKALLYMILFGTACLLTALIGLIPTKHWASYAAEPSK